MAITRYILLSMILFIGFTACVDPQESCEPTNEKIAISLGFYRAGDLDYAAPLDTSFVSVFAVGTQVELRGHRIGNKFRLPVPIKGGEVRYVFQQQEKSDTLALHFSTEPVFDQSYCAPQFTLTQVRVLSEFTSLSPNQVQIFVPKDYYEDIALAVMLP